MKGFLRLFKYCRLRIIKLNIENRQLKERIKYLTLINESKKNVKH